ncbi:hypothetical protein Hypma_003058 [Hypsizygus marmoreus]|uniref:DUF6534 domain-containing protein n=1 Tax=Hypsizygus marmoreus TaxID=39966 RepID=A0A369J2U2_HYPMA|nr:hypothetical protein Hypma_003058 [Hypsizygus marmoreus]
MTGFGAINRDVIVTRTISVILDARTNDHPHIRHRRGPPRCSGATMSTLPNIPPDISHLTVPLLVGSLLNYWLYGVLTVQVYIYHLSFPNDKRRFKALVYVVFVLETLQVCLSAADVYYWFGVGYGNMIHLTSTYLSPFDTPLLGSMISFIVQLFFCYRIRTLNPTRSIWWWTILITCVSITQLYGGVAGSVRGHLNRDFDKAHVHIEDANLWLIGNAVADVMIAATMTVLFLRARRQENRFTNDIVMRLVRLVMETNSLTAGMATIAVILFLALPNRNYFICPTLVIGKLYSNTILVTFNNRVFIARAVHGGHEISAFEAGSPPTLNQPQSITINVSQASYTESLKLKSLDGTEKEETNFGHRESAHVASRSAGFSGEAV